MRIITVNAMGDQCPIPVVKTMKALAAMTGEELQLEKIMLLEFGQAAA